MLYKASTWKYTTRNCGCGFALTDLLICLVLLSRLNGSVYFKCIVSANIQLAYLKHGRKERRPTLTTD